MKEIDHHMTDHPTTGVIGMRDHLMTLGILIGVNRVRRLMRLMGLMAIYPLKSLSSWVWRNTRNHTCCAI